MLVILEVSYSGFPIHRGTLVLMIKAEKMNVSLFHEVKSRKHFDGVFGHDKSYPHGGACSGRTVRKGRSRGSEKKKLKKVTR